MRKQIWTMAIPLALTIALTGCNVMSGAPAEEPSAAVKPLDAAAWPTPQPTLAEASPTPFPKITLAPTATPPPHPTATSEASAANATPSGVEGLSFTGNVGELVQQVTKLSGGFPPVAAAAVKTSDVTIRQGPADSYAAMGVAKQGELAAVLGKNAAGDWLYVLTRSGLQGWLPSDTLQITFSLGEAPILPPDPLAQKPAQSVSSASGTADLLGGLEPTAVALVTADGVTVRQGPASSYPSAGGIERGELAAVLGKSASGNWLYIVTISATQGWLPADTVRVIGSLAEAPVLPANPMAATQMAPASSPPSFSSQGGSAAGTASSQPLSIAALTPVAMAQVDNAGLNIRQGPGAGYELLGTLSRGDEVATLAVNKTQDWALVKTAGGQFGWVSLAYLAVDGSLADAPQVVSPAPERTLPSGRVAPIFPSSAASNAAVTGGNTGNTQPSVNAAQVEKASATNSAVAVPDLTPVAAARANQANVNLYRGPDTAYQPIVTLSIDETVSVLAVNQARDWALVKPTDFYKSPGWVSLQNLDVDGSLANASQVITAWVDSNELVLRRGPGIYYEQIGTVAINDLVAVLGLNQGRSWALVKPVMGGGLGWIPLNFLTINGSWSDVPQVPAPALVAAGVPSGQIAPPAGQASTSRPGKLVFQLSSGGDIMVINPDGAGLRRLTNGLDPVLSPDGHTVAFTRWTGEDGALWLIGVDGSNERPVLGGTKQAKHPSWSPDGQQIVVNFQHGGRLEEKEVCKNLIELGDRRPDIPWNVDSDTVQVKIKDKGTPYLCWLLPPDPHWGLRVVNVADGSFQDVPSDDYAFGPEWDPANPWRVLSSGLNGLVQLDINRSQQWAFTDRREDHTPAFSPDGRYLAVAYNNNGQYDIHRLNSDGSGRLRLTETPLWVTAQPDKQKPWNNVSPAWSPDGSQIAFLTDRTGRWEIWVMNADGSDQHSMFSDEVNGQLHFTYDFVDERMLSWR
jgi:uncharacterized protein YgiM (DUF1202 family)